jgi:transcriptional regulator with XRE-family HTH domain
MSQQQLADELSVTNKAISKWETGNGLPNVTILPTLASVLGVSIDAIISDGDKPVKKVYKRTVNIIWVLLAVLMLISVAYGVTYAIWSGHISRTFDPFFENEYLQMIPRNIVRYDRWIIHSYRDSAGSGYDFEFQLPTRLRLYTPGNIIVDTSHNENKPRLMIHTTPGNWKYVLTLDKTIDDNSTKMIGSAVDRNGQPLGRHPDDAIEFYQEWLALYEEQYDEIMKLFADMKVIFGENAFR